MPPRAAEFAVGGELEADLFLLLDDALDLAVFHRLERCGVDLALGALGARFLQRRRAQQAADMVGAEGRLGALDMMVSLLNSPLSCPAKAGHRSSRRLCG